MAALSPNKIDDYRGVWTALATPFRQDLQLDLPAFEKLLGEQESAGVTGVVIAGTTGEAPTLAVSEKLALIRKARAVLGSKTRIMAGTGDNNTQQSVELSRLAQDAGADSILVVTPPYNKPNFQGLVLHYQKIASAVSIPVCLYHVPGRTAQSLTVDALQAICRESGVRTVKEASGDLAFFARARSATGIPFLSGDDPTYLASLAVGGEGVISVVSNIFPKEMVDLTSAFAAGNLRQARALNDALLPAIDVLFCETNPCPLKAALQIMGFSQNTLRAPLAPVTEQSFKRIKSTLLQAREALAQVSRP